MKQTKRKKIGIAAMALAISLLLLAFAGRYYKPVNVLMLHAVSDTVRQDSDPLLTVSPAELETLLCLIRERGLTTGFPGEKADVILTFDDGYRRDPLALGRTDVRPGLSAREYGLILHSLNLYEILH